MPDQQVIHIHPEAPPMPKPGQPCNGCGVCCLAEPCPIGMVISRKRHGACVALSWSPAQGRYVCGVLAAAQRRQVAAATLSGWQGVLGRALAGLRWRWVRRHIAAGVGCDADLVLQAREQAP